MSRKLKALLGVIGGCHALQLIKAYQGLLGLDGYSVPAQFPSGPNIPQGSQEPGARDSQFARHSESIW